MNASEKNIEDRRFVQYRTVNKNSSEYDVLIVGAGHHGLTAAAFLAKAGKKVLVIEARDVVGGMCWSMDMKGAPGYRVNPCALEILLMGASPSIIDQLDLKKYGLKFVYPTTLISGLFEGGRRATFYKDLERTAAHFEQQFSKEDADGYRKMVSHITWALKAAMPYLMGPASRPSVGALWEILKTLLKSRKEVAAGARILMSSMDAMLHEYFKSEEIKIALGGFCLANFTSMSELGSGAYLSILTGAHEFGLRRPMGGSGQLTRAIAACVNDHGGDIRVSTPVEKIIVRNGRATGVALNTGEEISAKHVIAATDPLVLGNRLLDASDLPDTTHRQLKALDGTIAPINVFKIDLALRERPIFSGFGHEDADPEVLAALVLCQNMKDWYRSESACSAGTYDPGNMPLTTYFPSIFDRTMVPDGSEGETMYVYAVNTPYKFSDERTWESHSEKFVENCISTLETYAPGISSLIEDSFTTCPDQFEKRYNNYKGNYAQVGMASPTQLGPWRPIPDFANNKTPIDCLWNASAGSHPVPYLNGWAGRTVAGEILKKMK